MLERIYVPISMIERVIPNAGAVAIAHALSLGNTLRLGESVGFSVQLKQVEVNTPGLDEIIAILDKATVLSGKIWVTMDVTKEYLEAGRLMLATDPRFVMSAKSPSSMLKPG